MGKTLSREVHLVSRPDGFPKVDNFGFVERELELSSGHCLIKNLYMSVDPAMRPPLTNGATKLDEPMVSSAIGRVTESDLAAFPEGTYVRHRAGFREYTESDGADLEIINPEGESLTTHLHVLGMTGLTAYGGMLVTGALQEDENVFVSAAAGAVGSVAGQILSLIHI